MSAHKQNETTKIVEPAAKILWVTIFTYILIRACLEFYTIAWGTGTWMGDFSLRWGMLFFIFTLFCILSLLTTVTILWRRNAFTRWSTVIISIRKSLGVFRWLVFLSILFFPVWFLQYSPWGIVFSGLYIRLLLWFYTVLGLAIFLPRNSQLLEISGVLAALVLTSSIFSLAAALNNVTDYPFSLGWSEGNRMWDYSMLFGQRLYNISDDQGKYVLLDQGRQIIGGAPFIFQGLSIQAERLWIGLTTILPYLMLGMVAFRSDFKNKKLWVILTLWTFIFLKQGPIHPPLIIYATIVILLWRGPLWLLIPLIYVTGYFASQSRYTWLFAPAIWIVMLEFSGALLKQGRLEKKTWWRTTVLGVSGTLGGYFGHSVIIWFQYLFEYSKPTSQVFAGRVSLVNVTSDISAQPLLWYRLFPNATLGPGILLSLLAAIFPLLVSLSYLYISKKWTLNAWQKWAITLPLLAFLVIGIIVSTKIGGGGDLHNMDMFLIGLLFTAVIAWENGGRQWLARVDTSPVWIKVMLALLVFIPGIYPLSTLRSYQSTEDVARLVKLTDAADEKFLELLPPQEEVNDILKSVRQEIDTRKSQGEILFIDQRQLFAFGYISNVTLVPEYEKKMLMNEAMSENANYFSQYYMDLAAHRFSLIITEPLRAPIKDINFQFGEENNAWVKWVVAPTLCYYEEIETWKNVQIQLLTPRQGAGDCNIELPIDTETQK